MTSLLSAEISATCSALGYYEPSTNRYYADDNVLETLKDLIRYLRRDEDTHCVRRQLGETNVLVTDLLPLLKSYWEQDELFDVLLRLLVNLTTPPLILWNEEAPTDKNMRNYYLRIEDHLQRYKESFTDDTIWAILSSKLSKILELEYTDRGEENGLMIERILVLVRNILYVPSDRDRDSRPDNDANLHDHVLWALQQSGMLDIILFISSSDSEQIYYMHVIELLSFLLREQSPQALASSELERNQQEKREDESRLLAIRHQENSKKKEKLKQYTSARHSRFGGTFVVKSLKSISNNELIYHKPLNSLDKLDFDSHKIKQKTPKNRVPIKQVKTERHSAFSVRLFLKEFCIEFLNGSYNALMRHVKGILVRASSDTHDESYYLWALRFFMEFNRLHKCEVKLVSETMSKESFHYVQQRMEHDFDMLQSDKKKLYLWSKRLHLALLAYRELLLSLSAMDKSTDALVVESARIIKSNIFYVIEYRELILTLLITFDELKMSDVYLKDLLETQHIFLKMLEAFCKQTGGVVVAEKKKSKRKKTTKSAPAPPQPTLQDSWDEISSDLAAVLAMRDGLPEVVPVDFTLPQEEQKPEAMKNIQRKLRSNELETAVALLRACREVWPENDAFGADPSAPEEEYLIFQEIFFADLGEALPAAQHEDVDEEDEEDVGEDYAETTLKFEDFCKRLSHPKIVRACGLCLKNFAANSTFTNHCTVKLLHRIAFDCKMYVMMFQASIFRTFQGIFSIKEVPQYKELVKFATYIMRQFFKVAETNPKVYMEVLFWKSCKTAVDIEQGYGSYNKSVTSAKVWTEAEENELRTLYDEFLNRQIEEDVVDWVTDNLVDNTKSRRIVLKKMKDLGILTDYRPKSSGQKRNQPWTVAEETELQELFELWKDSDDPLQAIMNNLSLNRPKNRVVEKLLVMGVISDRSELRKKRKKKRDKARSDSDDDDGIGRKTVAPTRKKPTEKPKPPKAKPKRKIAPASLVESRKILRELREKGLEEVLSWLSENFAEAADDLENAEGIDADDGIPLVPLMEQCEAAFEDGTFQKFLLSLGMMEPTDEQVYWRIPCSTRPSVLRNYCGMMADVGNGEELQEIGSESVANEERELSDGNLPGNSSSKRRNVVFDSSEDEMETLQVNASSNRTAVMESGEVNQGVLSDNNEESDHAENDAVEIVEDSTSKITKKAIFYSSDEDESTGNVGNENKRSRENSDSEVSSLARPQKKRKKVAVLSSDDE